MSTNSQGRDDQACGPSRRRFLRALVSGAGALTAAPWLAACGASNPAAGRPETEATVAATAAETAAAEAPAEAAPPEPTSAIVGQGDIKLVLMYYGHEFSDEELKGFTDANQNIQIERIEWDPTRFKAMLAAGTPPDVFRTDAFLLPNLAEQGVLLDLSQYFATSQMIKPDDLAPANDYYVYKGKTYGMAKDWSPETSLFIYNTAFEEAGIPIPDPAKAPTYAEVSEWSKALTKREGDRTLRMGFGYETGWLSRILSAILIEQDQKLYTDDYSRIVLTENPQAVEALRYFYDLAKENVTWNPLNPSPSWIGDDFSKGLLGIVAYGYWYTGWLHDAEDPVVKDAITMLPGPSWTGKRRVNPTLTATGTVVSSATKQPEAAWKLLEYYSAGEPAQNRARSGWGLPALTSLYPLMPESTPFAKQVQQVVDDEVRNAADYVVEVNPYYQDSVFTNSWTSNLEQALRGTIDFDKLVANLEAEVNQAIDDGRSAIG